MHGHMYFTETRPHQTYTEVGLESGSLLTLFNQTARKKGGKTTRLVFFFSDFCLLQREEGLKKEADVFLDGVNNCRVTVWATPEQKIKNIQKSAERVEYVAGPQSVLATEIASTWLTQKSKNKSLINDIYWQIVNVRGIFAPLLQARMCTTAGWTHGGHSFSCVECSSLTFDWNGERQWL